MVYYNFKSYSNIFETQEESYFNVYISAFNLFIIYFLMLKVNVQENDKNAQQIFLLFMLYDKLLHFVAAVSRQCIDIYNKDQVMYLLLSLQMLKKQKKGKPLTCRMK